jgi:flavorubredoxin
MIVDPDSGTRVDEIAAGLYRVSTPVPPSEVPGGFSFNQFLLVDDEPLLFHTGLRQLYPSVKKALQSVMDLGRLRWISFCHVEADECGALNPLLAAAPHALPLCGTLQTMISVSDLADRRPRVLADGESLALGAHTLTWVDAPHVPHAWENGFLFETKTRTLFAGDLLTQPGHDNPPVTERDLIGRSEAFRKQLDYYAHAPTTRATLERLAGLEPRLLACMHGSSFSGDGAGLLRSLATAVG